ncbi:hypothetical protein GCM10011515_18890 [Tsuneonella deserti]|uniref:DUF418 domain-containing protein n=1 Tax=Tsuneonella deserti TaxID=2035528 RepID=A0ABQ1S8L0_9SPHN|nr:DUF418 domain-containing protein [Tsuneonella deserti]GGD99318.1 hypothetical protein GCM10011515_18890 [Tsuneonella deserti]
MTASPSHEPLPTGAGERLASLDFTRGVAVLGILAANIVAFGQPFLAYMWPGGFNTGPGPLSGWLWLAQFVLVDGKMRGLFTLLFGAGLALFADRAAARGSSEWLQVRRLGWLLAFGLAHYYLLWRGDILTLYALCGLIALFALRWSVIHQLAFGATVYVFGAVLGTAQFGLMWAATETSLGGWPAYARVAGDTKALLASEKADALRETLINTGVSYADYVAHAWEAHRWDWLYQFTHSAIEILPLMLFGMGLYRMGLFDGRLRRDSQARWGWAGVVSGTVLTLALGLWAMADGLTYTGTMFAFQGPQAITRLPVVLGLAALLALWGPRASGWLGGRVTAAGRMAFSNYLGTSLVMLLVFRGWGLGQFGALDRPRLYLVMLAAWLLMLAWSKPWLGHFRYGPLEWLWRCLTYGRFFAIRR